MADLENIIASIKSEIKVAADGKATISGRGLARLLDVSPAMFSAPKIPAKLAEKLAAIGVEAAHFGQGFPDISVPVFAQYYAYESKAKSTQAAQVLLAFSAIGVRTWMQQVAGYEPSVTATPRLSDIEQMKIANKALSQMIAVYEYANNKPGLGRMVAYAEANDGQPTLPGLFTIDDILDRTELKYTIEEKKAIGMYTATQYRSLTGKKPEQVKVCRTDKSGRKQYYSVAAYPVDFVPIIENAIELGFGS